MIVFALTSEARADRKVALIVGNSGYKVGNLKLINPANDAGDMATTLSGLGFEVVKVIDASKRDFDLALAKFARLATGADAALFYYAGHGMQFQGQNYLMPTDVELEDEVSVRFQMIGINDVRAALDRAPGVRIMILDACRNNPLAERLLKVSNGASRSLATTRGLARIDRSQGSIIAYATAADEVAQDGAGRNSPFTAALLKRMQEAGLEIEMMFRQVAADVMVQTGGRQRPETYVSLLSEYYLNQNDTIAWSKMKSRDNVAALREFVQAFPSSQQARIARERLEMLEQRAAPGDDRQRVAALGIIQPGVPQQNTPPAAQPAVKPFPAAVGAIQLSKPSANQPGIKAAPAAVVSSPAARSVLRFSDPVPFGSWPVNGKSIEQLAADTPLFAPMEGLDDKLWKRSCSGCHKWERQNLCIQGQSYVKSPASAFRNSHPYGGPFKFALMEWAKVGCQ